MAIRFSFRSKSKPHSNQAGLGLVFFGIVWTLFSSVFAGFGTWMAAKHLQAASWIETPCVIERFEILDDPNEDEAFTADVRYRYTFEGREFLGAKLTVEEKRYKEYHKLAVIQARVLPMNLSSNDSTQSMCRVNPGNPEESALNHERDSILFPIAFACFGLGFVAIGLGMIATGISGWRKSKNQPDAVTTRADDSGGAPLMILFPFFSLFGLAGLGIMFGVVVPMWVNWSRAKSWKEVPAEVIWSRVEENRDSDGSTYYPRVFFKYQWEGREFRSDRHRFSVGGSSGYERKRAVVDAHPTGAKVRCYVNPDAPWEAVIDRRLGGSAWFTLFPIPFILVGLFGLRYGISQLRKPKIPAADLVRDPHQSMRSPHAFDSVTSTQDFEFRSGSHRMIEFWVVLGAALFWNGIVSVFFVSLVNDWSSGKSPWFETLFLTPFVVVGLGMLGSLLHKLIGLTNPQLLVRLHPSNPRFGERLDVSWQFLKGPYPVEHLVIRITGTEHATYGSGKNSQTRESVFFDQIVHDSAGSLIHVDGQASIQLPAHLMHTWDSGNHSIEWDIIIHGKIRNRPDIDDEFPIQIFPPSIQ